MGLEAFGGVLWRPTGFTCYISSSGSVPYNSILVPLHSDDSRKTRLLRHILIKYAKGVIWNRLFGETP